MLSFPSPAAGIVIDFPGQIDWRVLAVSVAICIGATMLFALMPAIHASHVDLSGALKTGSAVSCGSSRSRLRSALFLFRFRSALFCSLALACSCRACSECRRPVQGSPPRSLSLARIGLGWIQFGTRKSFDTQLLDRVRGIPGVESATLSRLRPFSYGNFSSAPLAIDGYQLAPNEQLNSSYLEVAEDYFKTLGIPIVAGREFKRTDDENAPPVAIINETMAAKYWPGKDPVGQRLKAKDRWHEIVGVAKISNYPVKLEQPSTLFLRAGSPEFPLKKQFCHSDA